MLAKSRSVIVATALLVSSFAPAMAQQSNPMGNQGSNRSTTATPGTADNKAASGANSADVTSHGASKYGSMTGTMPGHTKVPGTASTTAGAAKSTNTQQTGAAPQSGSGK